MFPQTADSHSETGAGQAFPSQPIQCATDAEPVTPLFSWSRRQVRVGFIC